LADQELRSMKQEERIKELLETVRGVDERL
jgi:hypothetical protein